MKEEEKQNNSAKAPALIEDRFALNGTQLCEQRNLSATISLVFHFLGTISTTIVSSYLNPLDINQWMRNIFPDYIATLGGEDTEELTFKMIYFFKIAFLNAGGFFLLEKILERIFSLLYRGRSVLDLSLTLYRHQSALNALDPDLKQDECKQEITRLTQNIKKNVWVFQLENQFTGDQDFIATYLFTGIIELVVATQALRSPNPSVFAPILTFPTRFFYKAAWLFLSKAKAQNKRALFKPVLDITDKILSKIKLLKKIKLSFLEDSKDPESLWFSEFGDEGIVVIHNTGESKNKILNFYVMLLLSALYKTYFDVATLVIDRTGMIVNINDAKVDEPRWWLGERIKDIVSISLFNIFRAGYSTPQKIIDPFADEASKRLDDLAMCYQNIEQLKLFLKCLFGNAISSTNEIEVSYNPETNSFNTIMPFCVEKFAFDSFSSFEEAMIKNKIEPIGISYYILQDQLHIEHVNPWLKVLSPINASEYYQRARKTSGKSADEKSIETNQPDEKKLLTPSVIPLPESKRIIDHKPTVVIERGRIFTNTVFFVPKKELTITHIEWKRHSPSPDFKYYPLRAPGGKITHLALLLNINNDQKNIKQISETLDRGKVIRTLQAPGTYIRWLTWSELDDLEKTKLGIWTAAEKIYPDEKLKLTHKIHQSNHERTYGFTIENGAQVFYSNGETSTLGVTIFCVRDARSHKRYRKSNIIAADHDPHYSGSSLKKNQL